LKALAKERDDRSASVAELMTAFESAAQAIVSEAPTPIADQPAAVPAPIVTAAAPVGSAVQTPAPASSAPELKPRPTRTLRVVLGVIAAVVLAAMVLFAVSRNQSVPPPVAQQPAQPAPDQPLPDLAPLEAQFMRANEFVGQGNLIQADAEFGQVARNAEKLLEANPNLPPELLPDDWLGEDATRLFQEYHDLLVDRAEAYVDSVFAQAPKEEV